MQNNLLKVIINFINKIKNKNQKINIKIFIIKKKKFFK